MFFYPGGPPVLDPPYGVFPLPHPYSSPMHPFLVAALPYLPLLMPLVGWPLISALINLAFHKKTPSEWEAWALRKPGLAFFVELSRANGWDIAKNLRLVQRFAARRSGQVPEDVLERLPVSPAVRAALRDPHLRGALEAFVTARTPEAPPVTPDDPPEAG